MFLLLLFLLSLFLFLLLSLLWFVVGVFCLLVVCCFCCCCCCCCCCLFFLFVFVVGFCRSSSCCCCCYCGGCCCSFWCRWWWWSLVVGRWSLVAAVVCWFVCLVGWLLGCLVAWLLGCLVGCLLACLVGWLVGWLCVCLFVSFFVCFFVCLCVCLFVCVFVCLLVCVINPEPKGLSTGHRDWFPIRANEATEISWKRIGTPILVPAVVSCSHMARWLGQKPPTPTRHNIMTYLVSSHFTFSLRGVSKCVFHAPGSLIKCRGSLVVHPPGDTRLRLNFPRHNVARSRFCTIIQTLLMRIFQQKQSFQNSPDYMFRIRQNYRFVIPRFQRVIPWLFLAWASVELACRVFSCNPAAGDVKAVLDEQAWLTDESGLETFTTFVNSHYKHLLQR